MPRNLSLLLPTVFLAAACAADGPIGPDGGAEMSRGPGQSGEVTVRPAGGHCTTTVTPAGFEFPHVTIDIAGLCQLRHLGQATMAAIQSIDVRTGLFTNTTTYTAANDDQLHTTFAGISTSPLGSLDITFTGVETFVGGTGRFRNATGTTNAEGSATLAEDQSGVGEYRMHGWISY